MLCAYSSATWLARLGNLECPAYRSVDACEAPSARLDSSGAQHTFFAVRKIDRIRFDLPLQRLHRLMVDRPALMPGKPSNIPACLREVPNQNSFKRIARAEVRIEIGQEAAISRGAILLLSKSPRISKPEPTSAFVPSVVISHRTTYEVSCREPWLLH